MTLLLALGVTTKAKAVIGDTPVITYFVNGVDGMTTIVTANSGDALTIQWSATNVAYCKKWGVWGAGELLTGLSGTDIVPAPSVSVVTGENYQIDCYDASGVHIAQGGAQVNVSPAVITPTPTPTASPTSTSIKAKGEGIISTTGVDYIVVNKTKIYYNSDTRIKISTGTMASGMNSKWEGTRSADGSVLATRLEVQ